MEQFEFVSVYDHKSCSLRCVLARSDTLQEAWMTRCGGEGGAPLVLGDAVIPPSRWWRLRTERHGCLCENKRALSKNIAAQRWIKHGAATPTWLHHDGLAFFFFFFYIFLSVKATQWCWRTKKKSEPTHDQVYIPVDALLWSYVARQQAVYFETAALTPRRNLQTHTRDVDVATQNNRMTF